jgi:hypothetical protein
MKNVEQWYFSIGKTDERLLVTVFQQREENERLLVFQQWGKLLLMVFRQWKGKNETSAGRSCFGNKDNRGMAGWNVFGNGKKWKVLNRGVSASGRKSPVFFSGVSAS